MNDDTLSKTYYLSLLDSNVYNDNTCLYHCYCLMCLLFNKCGCITEMTRKTLVVIDLFYKTSTLFLKLSCNSLLSCICDLTLPTKSAILKSSVSQHFSHLSRDCECCNSCYEVNVFSHTKEQF